MQMSSNISIERKKVDCNALPKGWQREEVLRKSGISAGKVDVYYYSPTGKRIDSKPQLARYLGDAIDISSFDFQKGKFTMQLPPPSISLYRCLPGTSISASGSSSTTCGIGGVVGGSGSSITIVPQSSAGHSLKRKHKSPLQTSTSSTSYNVLSSTSATTSSSSSSATANLSSSTSNLKQQQQLEFSRAMRTDASLVPPIRQTASIFKQPVTVPNYERPLTVSFLFLASSPIINIISP
ncbi:methyl-CpG-binding domain protein 2 isoform X2 [Musca autumnalis]|uniref:methyl-CpG-binding domain protein 2 isoform X2 n=1 Tax=Musca autumnalis TaxID=221902 RepID=UPI003CF91F9B